MDATPQAPVRRRVRQSLALAAAIVFAACGSSVPSSPAAPSPSQPAPSSSLAAAASSVATATPTPSAVAAVGESPTAPGSVVPTPTLEPWQTQGLCPDYSGPFTAPQTVVVVAGDTLSTVAEREGVSVDQILHANPWIENASLIHVGDRIVVPADIRNVEVRGGFHFWPCTVGGWACDPNDPSTPVAVRLVIDGAPVSGRLADDAGVSFSFDLRSLSRGVEHQIMVQAQDLQTSAWVDLNPANSFVCSE